MKSSVYLFPMTRTLDSNFDDDRHSSSELKPHSGGKSRRNEMFEHHEPKHFESFYKMDQKLFETPFEFRLVNLSQIAK